MAEARLVERVVLQVPSDFILANTVCSYGFFMLEPNRWDSATSSFSRPLTLPNGTHVAMHVSQPSEHDLGLERHLAPHTPDAATKPVPRSVRPSHSQPVPAAHPDSTSQESCPDGAAQEGTDCATPDRQGCGAAPTAAGSAPHDMAASSIAAGQPLHVEFVSDNGVTAQQLEVLTSQVRRMLRLDEHSSEQVAGFHAVCPEAASVRFGYLYRSPTLWEDCVKTILLCNCGWGRTLSMAAALCEHVGGGTFPSPQAVAAVGAQELQRVCGLGYRAQTVSRLATKVCDGEVNVDELEEQLVGASDEQGMRLLLALPGIGPYGAANVLQLLGTFTRVAADTETVRHLRDAHGLKHASAANVQVLCQQVYARYHPYQFLAYWFELWQGYVAAYGHLSCVPRSTYSAYTGKQMRKTTAQLAGETGGFEKGKLKRSKRSVQQLAEGARDAVHQARSSVALVEPFTPVPQQVDAYVGRALPVTRAMRLRSVGHLLE